MSCSVEDVVVSIKSLCSAKKYLQLSTFLNENYQLLLKNLPLHDVILESLNISEHSLGFLFVLCVQSTLVSPQMSKDNFNQVLQQVTLFVADCSKEQVKFASGQFASVFHAITQELCNRKLAITGIKLVSAAIDILQDELSQLTSVHADLCQLCLAAKCYKPALKYLDIEISDINSEKGMMTSFYFLSYYYYGGMIYTVLKKFDRALYFFEQAVTCPATATSLIMIEAYKKYVLVSLILEGKFVALPKYTSSVIYRWIKSYVNCYQELISAYSQGSVSKLSEIVNMHSSYFIQDKNMGLVKQVVDSLVKRNIQKLTKSFITLSLYDVIVRANLDCSIEEVEKKLLEMIKQGEIFGKIDKQSKMVKFYDDPEKYNSPESLKKIDQHIKNFMDLDVKINEISDCISVSPAYLNRLKKSLKTFLIFLNYVLKYNILNIFKN